ncbi:MAG: MBL fold metallo-hydrolase [Clostridiales bacterium]|jgi:phosphoribosyl 1,2-cyclic phosphate phosphodiesterase|nr:MBL fold metallo-hydrolase [Clostridiales bacterium]
MMEGNKPNLCSDTGSEILFVGTGAADWQSPLPSGEFRGYASLLVDGLILIDCGSTTFDRMKDLEVDWSAITDIFITHSHRDHFDINTINSLADAIYKIKGEIITLHIEESWATEIIPERFTINPLKVEEEIQIGKYRILPLASNHKGDYKQEIPLHYLFFNGKVSWLYGTDGCWLLNRTWQILKEHTFDCWIVDCTIGDEHEGDFRIFEHNSLPMIRIMAKTFYKQGILKDNAWIVLTHLAKTLHPGQDQLETKLDFPFKVAYDGYIHII